MPAAPTVADLALPMQILPNATNGLPRYVVGQVIVGGRLQHATFDAGNPKASILTAADCLGCGAGCPKQVPACPPPAQFCRPSAPQEYVPAGSYQVNASAACPPGVLSAGTLDGKVVCQQCFDGGNHARFYHPSTADIFVATTGAAVPFRAMRFGALVRVTPATDRIWGNVGIGFGSDFLRQTSTTALGFRLRPPPAASFIWLNPPASRFSALPSAAFTVSANRDFATDVLLGFEHCGSATFRIDSGNQGVSIADAGIASALADNAQGEWASDGMLMVPAASWWQPPQLSFAIGAVRIDLPGKKWVREGGKTIFVRYHKNVLGLPFLFAGDFYFDDDAKKIFFAAATEHDVNGTAAKTDDGTLPRQSSVGRRRGK